MPTGYTYRIEEDCTFPEYLWGCARAFGAMIMMRDDPADTPIPVEFEPTPYERERIGEIRSEIAAFEAMGADEAERRLRAERDEAERDNREYCEKDQANRERYRRMADEVRRWKPPTPDHEGLKRFMLEQIALSMPEGSSYQVATPPQSPEEWRAARLADLGKDLRRAETRWREELERTEARNEWLRKLRGSVPPPAPARPAKGGAA